MTRALALAVLFAATASAQSKLKVIVDQDARGPCTTDIQSILMFVQSPRAEVLGIAWELSGSERPGVGKATIHFDFDLARFYDLYVDLMTRNPPQHQEK